MRLRTAGLLAAALAFSACGDEPRRAPVATKAAELGAWAVPASEGFDAKTGLPWRVRRTKDGAEMVLIVEGTFPMGALPWDSWAQESEKPRHVVTLTRPYYVDVHEVTVGQWKTYARRAGVPPPEGLPSDTPDDYAVNHVNWDDAVAYAAWAGVRLPTEAQWERAARGNVDGEMYVPGGVMKAPPPDERRREGFLPVKSYPPNEYGLYEMGGGVWEWCSDFFADDWYARSPREDPEGPTIGRVEGKDWFPIVPKAPDPSSWLTARVVRGGEGLPKEFLRASYRWPLNQDGRAHLVGFRCAKTMDAARP